MHIIALIVGLAMLVMGRKLYWLFIAGVGFVLGFELASRYLIGQPDYVILITAILAGVFGALLAIFVQKLALGLAGFVAGGIGILTLLQLFRVEPGIFYWIFILVGGAVGAVLVALLFDWALIGLSSLVGAGIIIQNISLSPGQPSLEGLIFIILFVAGIIVQNMIWRAEKPD